MYAHITFPEAIVVGLIQGVTELFPVSSLGHSVLIPALIGGSWAQEPPSAVNTCNVRPVATARSRPWLANASRSLHSDPASITLASRLRASHRRTSPSCPELANC